MPRRGRVRLPGQAAGSISGFRRHSTGDGRLAAEGIVSRERLLWGLSALERRPVHGPFLVLFNHRLKPFGDVGRTLVHLDARLFVSIEAHPAI